MIAWSQLGGALAETRSAEAVGVLEPARLQMLSWLTKHPDSFNVQKTLADVHNDLGKAFRLTRRPELALREHLAALAISDAILVGTPSDGISRKARAVSLVRAAKAEMDLGRSPAAVARLDEAEKYLADLSRATPADASLAELTTEAARLREEIQKKLR